MKALFDDAIPAIRGLFAALGGVAVSKWWFDGEWPKCVGVVVGLALLGFLVEWVGEFFLPNHPVAAVRTMEWWILVPIALGVAGAAALIVAAVEFTVPDTVKDPVTKETSGAIGTAISAFITAISITNLGDKDKSGIGDRIKTRLRRHYARPVASGQTQPKGVKTIQPGSPIEQLLHSNFYEGLDGWDRETRLERARGIAKALESSG